MEDVTFARTFEHRDEETGNRTRFPMGWMGQVTPEVADAAREGGYLADTPLTVQTDTVAPRDPGVMPGEAAGQFDGATLTNAMAPLGTGTTAVPVDPPAPAPKTAPAPKPAAAPAKS